MKTVVVEPPRSKVARIYSRVSTERQAKLGMSLEQQEKVTMDFFKYRLEPEGYQFGGFYRDPATSAKTQFLSRKAGFELSLKLEPGDCVLFAKLDRGFRNLRDMIETLEIWDARGVATHMLDIGMDTSTNIGRLILNIMGAVAQFERQRISERITDAMAHRREKGMTTGQSTPLGLKRAAGGSKRLVRDDHTRRVMGLIVEYREKGWEFPAMYWHFRKIGIRKRNGREVALSTIKEWYHAELRLRAKEESPKQIKGEAS